MAMSFCSSLAHQIGFHNSILVLLCSLVSKNSRFCFSWMTFIWSYNLWWDSFKLFHHKNNIFSSCILIFLLTRTSKLSSFRIINITWKLLTKWQYLHAELMLLGFISLLLTVFQRTIRHICVPRRYFQHMLPCSEKYVSPNQKVDHPKGSSHQFSFNNRKLLSESDDDDVCVTKVS